MILENKGIAVESPILDQDIVVVPIEHSCDYSNIKETDCMTVDVENEGLGEELSLESCENISQREADSAMKADNVAVIKDNTIDNSNSIDNI